MANQFVAGTISLTLGVIMTANVLIPVVKNTNTDTWTASEVVIWGMATLGAILGIVYGAFAIYGLA